MSPVRGAERAAYFNRCEPDLTPKRTPLGSAKHAPPTIYCHFDVGRRDQLSFRAVDSSRDSTSAQAQPSRPPPYPRRPAPLWLRCPTWCIRKTAA